MNDRRPTSTVRHATHRPGVTRGLVLLAGVGLTVYAVRAVRLRRSRPPAPAPSNRAEQAQQAEQAEQAGRAAWPGLRRRGADSSLPGARSTATAGRRAADALRLVALLASFALTAYAAVRLLDARPVDTAYWFVGSAVFHDLVLFPLYAVTDASLVAVLRRWPALAGARGVPWINHLRFPVAISGILLLLWTPLIFRLPGIYAGITSFSTDPYFERWVLVTVVLLAVSAVAYAARVLRAQPRCPAPHTRPHLGSN